VLNIAGALPFSIAPAIAPANPGDRQRQLRIALRRRRLSSSTADIIGS
jgi:hypothetical protein